MERMLLAVKALGIALAFIAPSAAADPGVPAPPTPVQVEAPRPPGPPAAIEAVLDPAPVVENLLVQDHRGRGVVARVYARSGDRTLALLPDGQLGFPDRLVPTPEPFVAATPESMSRDLAEGAFAKFKITPSPHYLVASQGSARFTADSVKLLEDLYEGLTKALKVSGVAIRPPEFPLVAIIFQTERDFRAYKEVAPEIQAYYEIFTNRIYLYETSENDQDSPEISALRRPQTVAHEGAHQVLQNIGVQPRLAPWPPWLIEGLAEFCSPPAVRRGGPGWAGLGKVNPLHMATIRDLADKPALAVRGQPKARVGRDPAMPMAAYLITRTELTPTDYALAWGLTHYLASRRHDEFLAYLRMMGKLEPLQALTPDDQLAAFRVMFGYDLTKMDRAVSAHLGKLKVVDTLPYYAVILEQQVGQGHLRRAALVSQSPSIIRQWVEAAQAPPAAPFRWHALPHPTRTRALQAAEAWIQGWQ